MAAQRIMYNETWWNSP